MTERTHHRRRKKRIVVGLLTLSGLLIWMGCSQKKSGQAYLVRVRTFTLTLSEFNQAVKAASEEDFAEDQDIEPAALNDLRMRVLNQLSEELVIAAFAADRGINITDKEIDDAVNAVKSDYPDNTFEETLLENAISFPFWRKQLATRLLVEKVIDKELISPVQITADDITQYYKSNYPQGLPEGENAQDVNKRIVMHLRRQKAEAAYKEWIDGLRKSYPVEVNQRIWNNLIGASH
jgi:SurA-like N-terminal domain